MAQLNTLVVKVMGDIKDVQAKLSKLDKRVKTTNKKITKFTKGIKDGIAKFAKYALAIGVVVVAIRKMTRFISSSIRAFNEQEVSLTKLESTLKSTGRFTLNTMDAMVAFADEMQRTTGISDTLVISAEAIMTTFTMISTETFPEAIELAADMSKLFGQDLQQSVIQLGTALNDPIAGVGRLKRIGISFSEDQRESIKLFVAQNNIMSAQRVILDELQVEIGGTSKAIGETFAGQSDRLKNSMTDVNEEIGRFIADRLNPFLPLAIQAAENMFAWVKQTNDLRDAKKLLAQPMTNINDLTRVEILQAEQIVGIEKLRLAEAAAAAEQTKSLFQQKGFELDRTDELITKIQTENNARSRLIENLKDALDLRLKVGDEIESNTETIDEETESLMDLNFELESFNQNMTFANNIIAGNFAPNMNELRFKMDGLDIATQNMNLDIGESHDKWLKFIELNENRIIPSVVDLTKKTEELGEQAKISAQDFFNAWDDTTSALDGIFSQYYKNQLLMAEGNEQKTKQIRQNQAKTEKAFGIFRTIVDTAQAVTKALATYPPPLSFIMAGLQFTAGAVQTALIAAQPLPALQEGGIAIKDTLAQIGEAGPEAVIPLSSDALKPFAQAIVGEIGKIQSAGSPNISMGGNTFLVKIGNEPIKAVVQKLFDNKQLRANVKTIR